MRQAFPQDTLLILLLPPSREVLVQRLHQRKTNSSDEQDQRLSMLATDLSCWREYDFVVVNEDLQSTVAQIVCMIEAERCKSSRQIDLDKFIEHLGTNPL